jgi:hypothetical protein
MGFVVDKVALGQVFPRVLRFTPVNFIPSVLGYKEKRIKAIIFITGLHNKPQRCGVSVVSDAGPFTTHTHTHTHTQKLRLLFESLIVAQPVTRFTVLLKLKQM